MLGNLSDPIFLLGFLSNLTALYLVITKSRKELSEYKKLLIIFLVSDLAYTIMQDLFRPIFVVRKDLFIVFLPGKIQNKIWLSIYCGLISMSFIIFASHFLFRAFAISIKNRFAIRLSRNRLAVICMILLSEMLLWCWICQVFLNYEPSYERSVREFYKSINIDFPLNPYQAILVFKGYKEDGTFYTEKFAVILSFLAIVAATFLMIIVSSIHITRTLTMRGATRKIWRKFHTQLFTALLVQLSIPCALLYFPCSFYLLTPFLNSDQINTPTWLLTILYSIYPILDPLAVIFMISDYRRALLKFLRWLSFQSEPVGAISNVSMTTKRLTKVSATDCN